MITTSNENDERWLRLKHAALEKQLETIFQTFRTHRIEPVVIKGWAAGLSYPEKWRRYSSDIDLAVSADDYPHARELLSDHPQILVDLHREIRHLDTQKWSILFENSRLINLGTTGIRVLSEEDHLRVLAVHWLQDGGAYRHRLWDIYYAVSARAPDFDWDKCLGPVSEKRKKWLIYTIGLAHKYLELKIDDLPFFDVARKIPGWMIRTVEKEWSTDTRLVPLENSYSNRWDLLKQIWKRFPPNAIQATIDMEGDFEIYPRIMYQMGSIIYRTTPSVKRLITKNNR